MPADAGSDIIGVDGITSLCADLGVDPADIVMLVLAFHLKADIMCEFTKEEWGGGLARLGCDSLEKLRWGTTLLMRRQELQPCTHCAAHDVCLLP